MVFNKVARHVTVFLATLFFLIPTTADFSAAFMLSQSGNPTQRDFLTFKIKAHGPANHALRVMKNNRKKRKLALQLAHKKNTPKTIATQQHKIDDVPFNVAITFAYQPLKVRQTILEKVKINLLKLIQNNNPVGLQDLLDGDFEPEEQAHIFRDAANYTIRTDPTILQETLVHENSTIAEILMRYGAILGKDETELNQIVASYRTMGDGDDSDWSEDETDNETDKFINRLKEHGLKVQKMYHFAGQLLSLTPKELADELRHEEGINWYPYFHILKMFIANENDDQIASFQKLGFLLFRGLLSPNQMDPRDDLKNSLLHIAVEKKNVSVVKLLLFFNATPEIKNASGQTPFQYAQLDKLDPKMNEIMRLLKKNVQISPSEIDYPYLEKIFEESTVPKFKRNYPKHLKLNFSA